MRFLWLLLPVLALVACSGDSAAWEQARGDDTIAAYETFLKEHPEGEHASAATERLAELRGEAAWVQATTASTIESYEAFLLAYGEGSHALEARKRISVLREDADWASARANGDPGAYRAHLEQYPEGRHASEAREWLGTSTYASAGDGNLGLLGSFAGGYIRHVMRLDISGNATVDGAPAEMRVAVSVTDGTIERQREKGILYRSPDQALEVAGSLAFTDEAGQKCTVPIRGIYVPASGDVLQGWLVTEDLRFGRTDVARLLDKQELLTGKPNGKVDPQRKVALFKVNGLTLQQ